MQSEMKMNKFKPLYKNVLRCIIIETHDRNAGINLSNYMEIKCVDTQNGWQKMIYHRKNGIQ